jgi:hypothetical protein
MATSRRRCTPVRLGEPKVVPISEEDYRQAVTALAVMIQDWWAAQERLRRAEQDAGLSHSP